MNTDLLIISFILILGFGIVIYLINKRLNKSQDQTLLEWLKSMQQSMDTNSKAVNSTLQENSKALNDRLDNAARVISAVQKNIGEMSEIGRSMKDLQEFLKSPKMRGNIGEEILKDLLGQMFPKNSFHLQYSFASGERVDAAVKTDAGILPIDAKFPMENFQRLMKAENEAEKKGIEKDFIRDIKKHIETISKKYILPDEGTMDFALMYVPSESVFYELANLPDVMTYARRSRVYPVSPSTLYAHLQTILLSFEGKKIESRSREVFKLLRSMQKDYEKVGESLGVLGKHLGNASAQFTNVSTGYTGLGQKLSSSRLIEEETENENALPQ